MAKDHQYGDAPIEDAYYQKMVDLARDLDAYFNNSLKGHDRHTGFILMVFPFGDRTGRANYISNGAAREDVITLMKEQIARFEGQPEMKGRA